MAPPQSARLPFAPLRPGDTVGIVAPAGAVDRDVFMAGCIALQHMGYTPAYLESIFERDLYFAGTVERRVSELEEMFRRPDVRAILCARGGYGCNYLLPELDYELIRAHPKLFIGYSDISALLCCFSKVGLPVLHGPMLLRDFAGDSGIDLRSWEAAVAGREVRIQLSAEDGAVTLIEGRADGVLFGGCLSILVASLGTSYECATEGKLLFLEDINARPYQIDRMLMQLRMAGKLQGVRGFIFGEMVGCGDAALAQKVIRRVLGDLEVPVAFGLRSGHVTRANIALPLGVTASLHATSSGLELHIMEATTVEQGNPISEQAGRGR